MNISKLIKEMYPHTNLNLKNEEISCFKCDEFMTVLTLRAREDHEVFFSVLNQDFQIGKEKNYSSLLVTSKSEDWYLPEISKEEENRVLKKERLKIKNLMKEEIDFESYSEKITKSNRKFYGTDKYLNYIKIESSIYLHSSRGEKDLNRLNLYLECLFLKEKIDKNELTDKTKEILLSKFKNHLFKDNFLINFIKEKNEFGLEEALENLELFYLK